MFVEDTAKRLMQQVVYKNHILSNSLLTFIFYLHFSFFGNSMFLLNVTSAHQSPYETVDSGKTLAVYENAAFDDKDDNQKENSYEELKDRAENTEQEKVYTELKHK